MTALGRVGAASFVAFGVSLVLVGAGATGTGCGSSSRKAKADASSPSDGSDARAPDSGAACSRTFTASTAGTPLTISIDRTATSNTFVPKLLFGINSAYWLASGDVFQTQPQVQAAGNYFIRYPGGSSSDDYHWNGTGSYDAAGRWLPSDTSYSPGLPGVEKYRGSSSAGYGTPAFLTDGSATTVWRSNTDTDFPSSQWAYVDFGAAKTITSLRIAWSTPYATSFGVQTWTPTASYPLPYQSDPKGWKAVSAGVSVGAGGTQTVTFDPVATEFVRVLMTASSDGPAGGYSIAELTAFNGTTQVTTNVATVAQSATTVSSTDPASTATTAANFDFESFMTYTRFFNPAADPVITVNVGTGSPAEAAAWVHYANVVRKYGIRYWQIGNEMEGNWETGGPLNAQDYVRRYVAYYEAMKAVDPSIEILGPVSGGINEASGLGDGKTFIEDFIELLHGRAHDNYVDAIDFHWYPNYNPVPDATALAATSQLAVFAGQLNSWIGSTSVNPHVPVFLTEYNLGIGSPNTPVAVNQLLNGLFTANALGEFIRYFGAGGGTNLWDMLESDQESADPTSGGLGYLQADQNAYRFQEHAEYWAMQMMAADWAIAGDTRTHRLVSAKSSQPLVAAYADERPDGSIAVAVINKDPTQAMSGTLQIPGLAAETADVWTFDASNYAWETSTQPYHANPDNAPSHAVYCGASTSTPVQFAPYSITVLSFGLQSDAGGPGAEIEAGASVLIDDMSGSSAQIRLAPSHAGDQPGSWYTYIGGGATAADTGKISSAPSDAGDGYRYTELGKSDGGLGPPAGDAGSAAVYAACVSGETPMAQYAYAAEGFDFENATVDGGTVKQYVDISAYTGIDFWIGNALPATSTVRVSIDDKESDPNGGICSTADDAGALKQCYAAVYDDLTVKPGWTHEKVPFVALSVSPYYGYPQPPGGDMTTATDIHFEVDQNTAPDAGTSSAVPFDFCIKDIALYQPAE